MNALMAARKPFDRRKDRIAAVNGRADDGPRGVSSSGGAYLYAGGEIADCVDESRNIACIAKWRRVCGRRKLNGHLVRRHKRNRRLSLRGRQGLPNDRRKPFA